MANHKFKLILNTLILFPIASLQKCIGFINTIILANIFDAKNLGIYSFIQNTSQTFYGLSKSGLDAGLHVSLSDQNNTNKINQIIFCGFVGFTIIALSISLLMFIYSKEISEYFINSSDLQIYVKIAAILFIIETYYQYLNMIIVGLNEFTKIAKISIINSVLTLIAVSSCIFTKSVILTAILFIISQSLCLAIYIIIVKNILIKYNFKFKLVNPFIDIQKLLKIGFPSFISGLFLVIIEYYILSIMTRNYGIEAIGNIRIIQAIMSIFAIFSITVNAPIITFMSNNVNDNKNFLFPLKISWFVLIFLSIFLVIFWKNFIQIFFDNNYNYALDFGSLLVIGYLFFGLISVMQGSLLVTKKYYFTIAIGFINSFLLFIFSSFFIEMYQFKGYLIAQSLTNLLIFYLLLFIVGKYTSKLISFPSWIIVLSIFTFLIIILNTYIIIIDPILINKIIIFIFTYLLFLFLIYKYCIDNNEKLIILDLVINFLSKK